MDWNKVSFVISGKRRISIVLSLLKKPKTSDELAKELKTNRINVLSVLRGLIKEKIVNKKSNGSYSLTKVGREIAKLIKSRYLSFFS